ncbi:hypothetical protein E4U42_004864 [Claviceps africana]|uniref:Uncharacterized protein n=1 Tax=Claviceps africana TaxID=83212 RepID=A0A8K0JCH0_9HYPO|nr:hypothetical protein E4U42_004864 [Claviceps africana]
MGGQGRASDPDRGDADPVMDQIARVVDAVNRADELGNVGGPADGEPGGRATNTKKRMWEEPGVVDETRPRDEL